VADKVVYGVAMYREDRDALLIKCPEKFGMNSADYMRLVIRAILDDRLIITKPEDKTGVFEDDRASD